MYCHTHNSLVLYFHEKSEAGSGGSRRSVQDMYVFYDHTTEMFGIRGYAVLETLKIIHTRFVS